MSSGVILLQRPYISFSSPLLLILRREITAAAAVALFLCLFQRLQDRDPAEPMNNYCATITYLSESVHQITLIFIKIIPLEWSNSEGIILQLTEKNVFLLSCRLWVS